MQSQLWGSHLVIFKHLNIRRHGVVVITTAQLHSTKSELRFCAGSNPARGVSEIRDGEDLWQWSRLEIKLNTFRRSTIGQKQFIIIIIKEFLVSIGVMLQTFYAKYLNDLNEILWYWQYFWKNLFVILNCSVILW